MSDVEHAEHVLNNLRQKRDAIVRHGNELNEESGKISYSAHTGDKGARQRLDKLNAEIALHDSELRSVDAAIAEAVVRVDRAQQAAAQAQDKAAAGKVRELAASITQRLVHADEFYAAAAEQLNAANAELREIHALGEAYPSEPQFRLGMIPALQTHIMALPMSWWREWSRFLPPGERRNFSGLWARMHGPLENRVRQRLGESERSKTEAA